MIRQGMEFATYLMGGQKAGGRYRRLCDRFDEFPYQPAINECISGSAAGNKRDTGIDPDGLLV